MRVSGPAFLCAGVLLAIGCSSPKSGSDAGVDAGPMDGGPMDAGPMDAGLPCALPNSCPATDKNCVGLASNAGQTTFGLRMSEIDLSAPAGLTTGIVHSIVTGAAVLDLAECDLSGSGTFNWLLQFDTSAGTLTTGGAAPVADPSQGYSFDTDHLTTGSAMFSVAPTTFSGVTPDGSGAFSTATGGDLNVPVFLNAQGTSVLLLPLHEVSLSGTLSSSNDCIGNYNAAGLDPNNSCQPDTDHPDFITPGHLSGYITLEEADQVVISATNQTLCVLLSGNASMYGETQQGTGVTVCKRDQSSNILYQGHWCSTTNMAAANDCADAEEFAGTFAASSVIIN